jgi:hypothetical protein
LLTSPTYKGPESLMSSPLTVPILTGTVKV